MRIWCIWDGHELLGLMSILQCYDHEFHCISDHKIWPASSKSNLDQELSMKKLVDYTASLELDFVIVPPSYESSFQDDITVLPLFESLVDQYIIPKSLVNKRWVVWDTSYELEKISTILLSSTASYTPEFKQSNNKHYHTTPVVTLLWVPQMKYHMLTYGKHDRMLRKAWRFELRTLKDAAIDTIIPANWSMLYREKIWSHHLNQKRVRVIGKKYLKEVFEEATQWKESNYSVTMHTNDTQGFESTFLSHKKRRWMLERGQSVKINRSQID